jgi:hypothetical protein
MDNVGNIPETAADDANAAANDDDEDMNAKAVHSQQLSLANKSVDSVINDDMGAETSEGCRHSNRI